MITALAATLFLTVIGGFVTLLMLLRRSETNYQVASRSLTELSAALLDEVEGSAGFYQRQPLQNSRARSLAGKRAREPAPT